jgi:hypothetical protein
VTAARDRLVPLRPARNLYNLSLIEAIKTDSACGTADTNLVRAVIAAAQISFGVPRGLSSFPCVAPAGKLRLATSGHPSGSRASAVMTGRLCIAAVAVGGAP